MHRIVALFLPLLLVVLAAPSAVAQEGAPATQRIRWSADLPTALGEAKKAEKPVMICVNAKHVDGRTDEEPAAKGLREVVYLERPVVEKSREFVCVFLTPKGGVNEYDELRALGIDGEIISPQHIFIAPAGDKILLRKEYWSHGKGERAVKALLDMMDRALKAVRPNGDVEGPGDDRAGWIAEQIEKVKAGGDAAFAAVDALIAADEDGDCTTALIELLPEVEDDVDLLIVLIRGLGRNGLEAAGPPIAEYLGHKEDDVRGNAAVSLEYIGSRHKDVVGELRKRADREKDEAIANHMYRALGRCGVEDSKARKTLLKQANGAKSEFASYGPSIGLAYFEGDKDAAKGVEEILKRLGVPGGRRGGGRNAIKRGVLSWTLAQIGLPRSGVFVREELIAGLENTQAFWVEGLVRFWDSVARTCEGEEGALGEVEAGVRRIVGFMRGDFGRGGDGDDGDADRGETPLELMDAYRTGRDTTDFEPKGDGLLGG